MSLGTQVAPLSSGVVYNRDEFAGTPHQQVSFFEDPETGLKAIIALHSTALGPALGGTRFYPYTDEYSAVTDVLRLSRGMTYKAAVAGLPLGGGKAVIIGDPRSVKSDALLESYGRFVDGFGGRYITAGDVGTTADDMDVVGRTTQHVVARNTAAGGSGDSAPLTALGVFCAIRGASAHVWGAESLSGKVVGVEGAGKVGHHLIQLLLADGARVIASDIATDAVERLRETHPAVEIVNEVKSTTLDVYAPCALGGTVTESSARSLGATIVCGAANNQLATPAAGSVLRDRGIVWVPDFVANAGGLIQVAGELAGDDESAVRASVEDIYATVRSLLETSEVLDMSTNDAALALAVDRLGRAQ
ncbi:valine dehydrogenase [Prescottella equi]|uniref:Glu/Leu/Phe/Val family dehydrogenase n=1 Tax=Rhodococcus hoagii TaxID=43767 RepID=UPI000A0FFB3C|nr:Glu/Leu/Phe/Val dehydrogenase dimerization domain-containing protein [Prescottella equi]ORJ92524.1 valine dehydrogenase [Prescottella equi]